MQVLFLPSDLEILFVYPKFISTYCCKMLSAPG